MKVNVEFIVSRLNGKILFIETIQDCYSNVQVIISKSDLDEDTIKDFQSLRYKTENETGFNLGECEAKDITGKIGNVVIAIETVKIELN